MENTFELTDDERSFLAHWMHEAMGLIWGPAITWCCINRINWSHGPYTMAMIFSREEIDAGREGWFFDRPPVPFRVPWKDHDEFWQRDTLARSDPRIQGVGLYPPPSSPLVRLKGTLTPEESNFLRAYHQEMMITDSGYHMDLAKQHGVMTGHLIAFLVRMKDLYQPTTTLVAFPWTDFPARYEELTGLKFSDSSAGR